MEQWEYMTRFMEADRDKTEPGSYSSELAGEELPIYSPQTMMPELNRLGSKGWELVHIQPVYIGTNHDILVHEGGGSRRWTHTYFCVFKRPT